MAKLLRMKKIIFNKITPKTNQPHEIEENKSASTDNAVNIEENTIDKISEYSDELEELKWKYAAYVLERLIFIISIIFFTLSIVSIVYSCSNFYILN